jgi:hypothetical protein
VRHFIKLALALFSARSARTRATCTVSNIPNVEFLISLKELVNDSASDGLVLGLFVGKEEAAFHRCCSESMIESIDEYLGWDVTLCRTSLLWLLDCPGAMRGIKREASCSKYRDVSEFGLLTCLMLGFFGKWLEAFDCGDCIVFIVLMLIFKDWKVVLERKKEMKNDLSGQLWFWSLYWINVTQSKLKICYFYLDICAVNGLCLFFSNSY